MLGGKFSQTRFSLRNDRSIELAFEMDCVEELDSSIKAAADAYTTVEFSENTAFDALGALLIRSYADFAVELDGTMDAFLAYPVDMSCSEELQSQSISAWANIHTACDLTEALNLVAIAGADLYSAVDLRENLSGTAVIGGNAHGSMTLSASLNNVSRGELLVHILMSCLEKLSGYAKADLNVSSSMEVKEELQTQALIVADIYRDMNLSEQLKATSRLGANIRNTVFFSEMLNCFADVATLEEQETILNVSVPPGSELRFDTEKYTVTLDGINILYLQKGDWPQLERELMSLLIDTGTAGSFEGEVIYRERWL